MSDPQKFPSKTLIKFLVDRQLLTDSSGSMLTSFVRRQGGAAFTFQFHPDGDYPIVSNDECGAALVLSAQPGNFQEQGDPSKVDSSMQDKLLADIYTTVLDPVLHPELYTQKASQKEVLELEQATAMEIVKSYRRIKSNQVNSVIQSLNNLLSD